MSNYPGYQDTRLIVNGVDLTTNFQMILIDGYVLSPPEPKFYRIDIPGGNGVIDLTESLAGDVLFSNRSQDFTFKVIYPNDFERIKTRLSNFLHGKAYDYTLSFDPGYTYHGRFTVSSYAHDALAKGILGDIQVHIDADPYKMKEPMVYRLNANTGRKYYFNSGRMPVRPVIETTQPTTVVFKGERTNIGVGTFRLNKVLFTEGINELYINTYELFSTRWEDLAEGGQAQMTWDEAAAYTWDSIGYIVVHEGYTPGSSFAGFGSKTWDDMREHNWNYYLTEKIKWEDLVYNTSTEHNDPSGSTNPNASSSGYVTAYLTYEWGDL